VLELLNVNHAHRRFPKLNWKMLLRAGLGDAFRLSTKNFPTGNSSRTRPAFPEVDALTWRPFPQALLGKLPALCPSGRNLSLNVFFIWPQAHYHILKSLRF
jgi:hypothetical protein